MGSREVLDREIVQKRLLLCLFGIGTTACASDIFYGKGGEVATNRLEDQELSVLSLHLLQICLVYVNTLMIRQILSEPRWDNMMTTEDYRALTPLIYSHVNPYGEFELNMEQRLLI